MRVSLKYRRALLIENCIWCNSAGCEVAGSRLRMKTFTYDHLIGRISRQQPGHHRRGFFRHVAPAFLVNHEFSLCKLPLYPVREICGLDTQQSVPKVTCHVSTKRALEATALRRMQVKCRSPSCACSVGQDQHRQGQCRQGQCRQGQYLGREGWVAAQHDVRTPSDHMSQLLSYANTANIGSRPAFLSPWTRWACTISFDVVRKFLRLDSVEKFSSLSIGTQFKQEFSWRGWSIAGGVAMPVH